MSIKYTFTPTTETVDIVEIAMDDWLFVYANGKLVHSYHPYSWDEEWPTVLGGKVLTSWTLHSFTKVGYDTYHAQGNFMPPQDLEDFPKKWYLETPPSEDPEYMYP